MADKTTETRTTLTRDSTRVMAYLEGVHYPADKSELAAHASQRGAPMDVLAILDNLPNKTYASLSEVNDQIEALTSETTPESF